MRFCFPLSLAIVLTCAGTLMSIEPPVNFSAGPIVGNPFPEPEAHLQNSLNRALTELRLNGVVNQGRMAVSLVDLTDRRHICYAEVNDCKMMYAASLPKIAVLLAAFEKIHAGLLNYTPQVKQTLTRMIRFSNNADASWIIREVSFPYIASVLTSGRYRLYDPEQNGGLWIGKAYGGSNDRWKRDPLNHISHGATSRQVAKFFYLLDRGLLVSPTSNAEMKEMLSKSGIHHKFVKGLESRPGERIYRKSGTWKSWHSDSALVVNGHNDYIAVALIHDSDGGHILAKLIAKLDDIICGASRAPVAR